MPVLHQIIAIEKGAKARLESAVTEHHKANQKADLFAGLKREYAPFKDDGDKFPSESVLVQRQSDKVLKAIAKSWTEVFDITAQRDFTNCVAKADVVVDGITIVKDAPATFLLYLEKRLLDVRTLIAELPTLDPAHTWTRDEGTGLFNSNEIKTVKTVKDENIVITVQATKEHPAQTAKVTKDIGIGIWTNVKLSGALPITRKEELIERVEKVIKAVKFARETANSSEVVTVNSVGDALFGFLLR